MVSAGSKGSSLAVLFALGLAACGGESSGGSSCAKVAGCGGDITGLWHVTAICTSISGKIDTGDAGSSLPPECSSALSSGLASAKSTPVNATVEFKTDGTYVQTGSMRLSSTANYTASCMHALGATTVDASLCSRIGSSLMGQMLGGGVSFESMTCTFSGGGCVCNFTETAPFGGTGTYHTQGTELTLDSDAPAPYCVQGTTASLASATSGASGRLDLSR
jgi:hypothetical protein